MLTSPSILKELASLHGTPLYLLSVNHVLGSMKTLRDGLAVYYPNSEISYSVKTNYLADILGKVLNQGFRLEVVSRHEMALAQQCGAKPVNLLFNGPVKSPDDLGYCYQHSIDVNLDSADELAIAATIGTLDKPFRLGLRAAATLKNGNVSRFGIHFEDLSALNQIRSLISTKRVEIVGLHTHHSSRRDAQSYCDRLDHLHHVAQLLGIEPSYLDIGGGVGSNPPPEIAAQLSYPIDDPQQLATMIGKHAFGKFGGDGPRIIMEPGIAVLAQSMNYLTRIVSVKNRGTGQVAVCDGSLFDVNPLRSTIFPPCYLLASQEMSASFTVEPTRLYGGTCMEIDQIGVLLAGQAPTPGDLVLVTNVGAYSACLAPHFIIPSPPVYSLDSDRLVRQRAAPGCFTGAGQ
jgi:diaminopimelate decarboxylase